MSSYDLVCETCGATFEVFRQGFLREEDLACPLCGSLDVRQKITGFMTGTSTSESSSSCDACPGDPGRCCGPLGQR